MTIRNRTDDQAAFDDGWDMLFGKKPEEAAETKPTKKQKKAKVEEPKEKPKKGKKDKQDKATRKKAPYGRCPHCQKPKDLVTISGVGWSRSYFSCINKRCDNFQVAPARIENCVGEGFVYNAGKNMERAKGERRAAEAQSHMGNTADIYNHIEDFETGAEDRFGPVQ